MHGFSYKNGSLHCEDVDLSSLAEEHGTPLYVYSAATILDHYRRWTPRWPGSTTRWPTR
jgi:diaminopimelate decarboxylase